MNDFFQITCSSFSNFKKGHDSNFNPDGKKLSSKAKSDQLTAHVSPLLKLDHRLVSCLLNLVNLQVLGFENKNTDSLILVFHDLFRLRKEKIRLIFYI